MKITSHDRRHGSGGALTTATISKEDATHISTFHQHAHAAAAPPPLKPSWLRTLLPPFVRCHTALGRYVTDSFVTRNIISVPIVFAFPEFLEEAIYRWCCCGGELRAKSCSKSGWNKISGRWKLDGRRNRKKNEKRWAMSSSCSILCAFKLVSFVKQWRSKNGTKSFLDKWKRKTDFSESLFFLSAGWVDGLKWEKCIRGGNVIFIFHDSIREGEWEKKLQ